MTFFLSHFNYFAVAVLMMAGLFIVFSSGNLIKRTIGLAIFQTATGETSAATSTKPAPAQATRASIGAPK